MPREISCSSSVALARPLAVSESCVGPFASVVMDPEARDEEPNYSQVTACMWLTAGLKASSSRTRACGRGLRQCWNCGRLSGKAV